MKPKPNSWFGHWARTVSHWTGRPIAFMLAALLIVGWLITGPIFHYSDTWQLVINTTTTIVTFLMVFLIQNTQNRDTEALQLKLDELIRASPPHCRTLQLSGAGSCSRQFRWSCRKESRQRL